MGQDKTRSQEYDSLRAELLLLFERAHDVWRWGLVSMIAVFGALAVLLAGMQPTSDGKAGRLTQFLVDHGTFAVLALDCFFAGMAERMSRLRTLVLEEMHRIGAYVAVFHDEAPNRVPDTSRQLSWHAWNRIDKFLKPEPRVSTSQPSQRKFHGTSWVYVLVLAFIVAGTTAVLDTVGSVNTCLGAGAGFAICIVVAARLWRLERNDASDAAWWNRRWAKLAQLDETKINALLVKTGLRADGEPAT